MVRWSLLRMSKRTVEGFIVNWVIRSTDIGQYEIRSRANNAS